MKETGHSVWTLGTAIAGSVTFKNWKFMFPDGSVCIVQEASIHISVEEFTLSDNARTCFGERVAGTFTATPLRLVRRGGHAVTQDKIISP